jgi:hypothetical protein
VLGIQPIAAIRVAKYCIKHFSLLNLSGKYTLIETRFVKSEASDLSGFRSVVGSILKKEDL